MNEAAVAAEGFGYFVGVSIGVVVIITSLTIVSYLLCARSLHLPVAIPPHPQYTINNAPHHSVYVVDVQAIDEATTLSYLKLLFCEATHKGSNPSHAATCCSICLSDFKDTDTVRVLPDCGHLFHLHCVDPWLRMHPTCPNCRTSPVNTPS